MGFALSELAFMCGSHITEGYSMVERTSDTYISFLHPAGSPYKSKLPDSLGCHLLNVKIPLEVLPYVNTLVFLAGDTREDSPTEMV